MYLMWFYGSISCPWVLSPANIPSSCGLLCIQYNLEIGDYQLKGLGSVMNSEVVLILSVISSTDTM